MFPNTTSQLLMKDTEQQWNDAGIHVPSVSNNPSDNGAFSPNSGDLGTVDIYGIDSYPLRWDCKHLFLFGL